MQLLSWENAFAERFVRSIKEECLNRNDLLRTGIASAHDPAVHGALLYRAQSPGPGKPTSAARIRHRPTQSLCPTPTAPRRNAQLLPSGRSLTKADLFGQFATGQRMIWILEVRYEVLFAGGSQRMSPVVSGRRVERHVRVPWTSADLPGCWGGELSPTWQPNFDHWDLYLRVGPILNGR
jgi:hypothetical protein